MAEQEEKVQKLYIEFHLLNQQIQQLEKQNEALNSNLMELMVTNQSLDELEDIKEKTEILVPVSTGIHAKAEIKDVKSFVVNVGANVALVKDLSSTKKIIENQIGEVRELQESLAGQLQKHTAKAALLEQEISNIASEIQK
ncbi:prefoldin subunit alpha [Candidatus Woesearchaeota archaeon]|nr:prefoldin subunit alpha [Candidatus Woesearchaeota archaeon]